MTIEIKKLGSNAVEKPQLDETRVYHHADSNKVVGSLFIKSLGKPQANSLPETEKGIDNLISDLFKGLKSESPDIRERTLNELYYFKNLAEVYLPKGNEFYTRLTTMWAAYGNELSEGL